MFNKETFKGKKADVTGGRSGIGLAIAKQLLTLGASVIICSRKEELLKTAAQQLKEFGDVDYMACDIRETDQINLLTEKIKSQFGRKYISSWEYKIYLLVLFFAIRLQAKQRPILVFE